MKLNKLIKSLQKIPQAQQNKDVIFIDSAHGRAYQPSGEWRGFAEPAIKIKLTEFNFTCADEIKHSEDEKVLKCFCKFQCPGINKCAAECNSVKLFRKILSDEQN